MENILIGFQTAFTLSNLWFAFLGVFLGNLIGVLPGIGALAAISMLLPLTYGIDPTGSLVMLAGIYYGTSFGGATTSILLNLPGTAAHAVVCLDGNPMARQGKGGQAIFIAMFASFIGATVGIVLVGVFSPVITRIAFAFGPSEYFVLMLMGILAASVLSTGHPLKGVASILIGLILGCIGIDVNTGVSRFDFGFTGLQDGIGIIALAMGLFGVADVLKAVPESKGERGAAMARVTRSQVRPDAEQMRQSAGAIGRGSVVGSALGALPGIGGTVASFISYAVEKRVSKHPEQFGRGAVQGVAGPEAANSSADIAAFIPTLTLGIPGSAVMALLLGALMIHDIVPGPRFIIDYPEMFWGLWVSFIIGNIILVLLNIPLIRMWTKLLEVPYRFIFPVVLLLIMIGVYSTNNSFFDVGIVFAIGVLGYVMKVLDLSPAPMLLSFVLGPMIEENFRRALLISDGNILVFVERPLSAFFLLATAVIVAIPIVKRQFQRLRHR